MYVTDYVATPQLAGWHLGGLGGLGGLGQPIDASTGPDPLNAAQLARAVQRNRVLGVSLGWKNLYIPITTYYLRFRNRVPSAREFAQAIARWQTAVGGGLSVNGILDRPTLQRMLPRGEPDVFSALDPQGNAVQRPSSLTEVIGTFGDPRDPNNPTQLSQAWEAANIVNARAPANREFQLYSGGTRRTIRVHRLLRSHFENVLAAIADAGLWDDIQPVSGPFVFRNVAGGNNMSMHAFGIAIDINPDWYPRRRDSYCAFPVPQLVSIFQDHGFHWGIFFGTPDPMHFQFATGA